MRKVFHRLVALTFLAATALMLVLVASDIVAYLRAATLVDSERAIAQVDAFLHAVGVVGFWFIGSLLLLFAWFASEPQRPDAPSDD